MPKSQVIRIFRLFNRIVEEFTLWAVEIGGMPVRRDPQHGKISRCPGRHAK